MLAIFLGGGLGSLLRYGTTRVGNSFSETLLPVGTILSNIVACVILALLVTTFKSQIKESQFMTHFMVIGVCGGYSTFSTFSMETVQLVNSGHIGIAIANVLISVIVCFGLIYFILKA